MADDPRSASVFINCPFDPAYQPLFDALVFTVSYCTFNARSALELVDSGEPRLTRIIKLIGASRFSIHDISRVELDQGSNLPRFNMPIELGVALGSKHLGSPELRDHLMLVLDGARASSQERYRYQAFASDLAGVDIKVHCNQRETIVSSVRDFLAPHATRAVPGPRAILEALDDFDQTLPDMVAEVKQDLGALTYVDRLRHIGGFIARTLV